MQWRSIATFRFSRAKGSYFDVLFVGPLAARLSREIYHNHGSKFSCLNINSSDTFYEPTLYPIDGKPLNISQTLIPRLKTLYSQVSSILPEQSAVLVDGEKIYYNQLVYTSNDEPDYSRYEGLKEAVSNECNNVFVNNGKSIKGLKEMSIGNLVFSIPAGRHLGQDNYQFLYLTELTRNRLKGNKEDTLKTNSILILEDGKIFKHNHDLDQYAKTLCRKSGIDILENVKVDKVDTISRSLKLSSGQSIPYGGYYQYLPLKSHIDGQTNPQTLINQKYGNVFVFGNAEVPTTHSYGAKNYQLRVAKDNLIYNLLNTRDRAIYDGRTIFPFWITHNKVVYFSHSYNKKLRSFGKSAPFSIALAALDKWMGQHEVKNYYKFNTYGYPYYLWNKKVKTIKTNQKSQKRTQAAPRQYELVRKVQT